MLMLLDDNTYRTLFWNSYLRHCPSRFFPETDFINSFLFYYIDMLTPHNVSKISY